MSGEPRLKVVLCWHMHQPQYWDRESGQYQLPWTYLHGIKDYVDMAAIIDEAPGAKAVVNYAPILLEQIDDYATQVREYLQDATPIHDPLLAALVMPALPNDDEHRIALIKACLRANQKRLVERFPPYKLLADLARCIDDAPASVRYFDQQYLVDILAWYHIAWMGETVRRTDKRIQALMAKGRGFSQHDRRTLLEVIGEILTSIIPRYRKLAEEGRVELAVSPYAHPIVPLLLDLNAARDAMPDVRLPLLPGYPQGRERAEWQIREGIRTFERYFGFRPKGCWPSEGGISADTLELLANYGFSWAASGEAVLRNTLARAGMNDIGCIHRAYRVDGTNITCFFRDDGLSDLIGFTYSDWHGDDAVNNLIHHLENIADACKDTEGRIVSIILDGENAWEYYPENAYYFLSALYRKLGKHPRIELSTFADCLSQGTEETVLPQLVAGSWVYGTFSTWIGDPDKNRGWELLGAAKQAFDRAVAEGRLTGTRLERAEQQLAVCEGSDWFWWFGDYNPSESVRDFERLFRQHLAVLYQLIGEEPPDNLSQSISQGGGNPQLGGVMRRGQEA